MIWVSAVIMVLGTLVAVGSFVYLLRTAPPVDTFYRLTGPEKKVVMQKVRRGEAEGDLPVLRSAARTMVRQRGLIGTTGGFSLIQVGIALPEPSRLDVIVLASLVAVLVGLSVMLELQARAGAAFLARHPE